MKPQNPSDSNTFHWHALYTFPRFEKKVLKFLHDKGIIAYLPLQKKLRKWKDRKKWVEEPLFRSYIFVKVSEKEYYEAVNTQGIVKYVTFSGKAVKIPEIQMDALQRLVESDQEFVISIKKFKQGDKIRINKGPFAGFEGEMINYKGGKKMLIRFEQIGCSFLIEIPVTSIEG